MFSEETSQGHTWLQWACLSRMDSFSMMCSLKGFSSKVFNLTLNVSIPSTNALWIWQLCDILDINTWSSARWGHCLVSLWCHNHGLKICGLFWKLCVCIDCMHAARHVSHGSGSTVLGLCRFSPGAAAFSHTHAVRRVRWLVIINCCRRECKSEGCLSVCAGPQIGDLPQVYPTSRPMVAWIGSSPSQNSSCTWTVTSEQHFELDPAGRSFPSPHTLYCNPKPWSQIPFWGSSPSLFYPYVTFLTWATVLPLWPWTKKTEVGGMGVLHQCEVQWWIRQTGVI